MTALPPEKRGIGLVFQNYALYPHLTVEQNIAFPLVNHKEGKEEIRRRTLEMALSLIHILEACRRRGLPYYLIDGPYAPPLDW